MISFSAGVGISILALIGSTFGGNVTGGALVCIGGCEDGVEGTCFSFSDKDG
jgi:hypothetical protein